ncbi:uncharacterized mitochondrial protein AtMg00810-like [Nicotiana sylvestris]|uniref:Uncharacterized mitochondrial protein AtMg00810-like n=1 Tax=Nicotiana tabacum TaxID=4097 RepID=A0A1S3X148_TOBAC|nr:PREDICTED: uncharacterized mitochondrial protein AtMg00810-like [Nicotiana tabacum]
MKDLGELKYFLGIEFSRFEKGILMCQRKYALELVSELVLAGGKPASTHLEFNQKLTFVKFDQIVKDSDSEDVQLKEKGNYQRLVGRLSYLIMTRPDIAFVIQVLSQYMHAPKTFHMKVARRVVKYIKSTPGLGLFMPTGSCNKLIVYCDSDWGACVESRRSIIGYVVKFGDVVIFWKLKKQGTISRSSTEAEFRSMTTTVAEIMWLFGLFKELLGVDIALHVPLHYDSKAAIQIAAYLFFPKRTKHIDIDCHFVREKLVQGLIQTQHVGTTE